MKVLAWGYKIYNTFILKVMCHVVCWCTIYVFFTFYIIAMKWWYIFTIYLSGQGCMHNTQTSPLGCMITFKIVYNGVKISSFSDTMTELGVFKFIFKNT